MPPIFKYHNRIRRRNDRCYYFYQKAAIGDPVKIKNTINLHSNSSTKNRANEITPLSRL